MVNGDVYSLWVLCEICLPVGQAFEGRAAVWVVVPAFQHHVVPWEAK